MLEIKAIAATTSELRLFARFLTDLCNLREGEEVSVNLGDAVRRESVEAPQVVEEKPKRSHSRTNKAEEVAQETAAQQTDDAPAVEETVVSEPSKSHTLDDVRDALRGFASRHGMDDAMTVLKTFGANRISELAESDYAAFIEKASV